MAQMTFFLPMGSGLSLSAIALGNRSQHAPVSPAQAANSRRSVNFY